MNDSKWPDTRELWVCLNCGSVEWHLRGEVKAVLCECVAGVWTAMEQVWPAPSGWISVEHPPQIDSDGSSRIKCLVWWVRQGDAFDEGAQGWRAEDWAHWIGGDGSSWTGWQHRDDARYYTHWQPGPSAPE